MQVFADFCLINLLINSFFAQIKGAKNSQIARSFQQWWRGCADSKFFFKIPVGFPLVYTDLRSAILVFCQHCNIFSCIPQMLDGHNVLGVLCEQIFAV